VRVIRVKRTALILTIISTLLFATVAGTTFINLTLAVSAEELLAASPHSISIISPDNTTIYKDPLLLNFTVTYSQWGSAVVWQIVTSLNYSIDGGLPVSVYSHGFGDKFEDISNQSILANVSGLSSGQHKIEITAVFVGCINYDFVPTYTLTSAPSYFIVDTLPPKISIQSVRNETYYATEVPLTFTVNEQVSQLDYSIDGQAKVTISGSTTLPNLSYGSHNLTLYATDIAGNLGFETVYFTIDPFPWLLVVAASLVVAATVSLGILVYWKKRKRGQ
jgi:hypothetical protein